jgi:hypothetical protein
MQKEYNVCLAIANYLRLQYPSVEFHFDLAGNNLSEAARNKNKAIQKRRGFPDLQILEPRDRFAGLFIEIKAPDTRLQKESGVWASDHILEQAAYLLRLTQRGYLAEFGVGFDECKRIIDNYLSLPK